MLVNFPYALQIGKTPPAAQSSPQKPIACRLLLRVLPRGSSAGEESESRGACLTFCLGLRVDSKVETEAAASADSVGGAIRTTPDDLPTTSTSSCT